MTMKLFRGVGGALLTLSAISLQASTRKVFLLEDAANKQWCSYFAEPVWKTRVEELGSMNVGALLYSNGHLEEIDVTETDESGDWIVYDRYFVNETRQLVKLVRLLNVVSIDRGLSEVFKIENRRAVKKIPSRKATEHWKDGDTSARRMVSRCGCRDRPKEVSVLCIVGPASHTNKCEMLCKG